MLAPSNQSTFVKVPARYLLRGDVTGSGEVVLSVSVGAKTPRGMVDVLLEKGDRKRAAIWNARTIIGVRRGIVPPVGVANSAEIPLSDRLPTFHELASFDAGNAWDRLSQEQQRTIGMLALRFGTVGRARAISTKPLKACERAFHQATGRPRCKPQRCGLACKSIWSKARRARRLRRCASTSIPSGPSYSAGRTERR